MKLKLLIALTAAILFLMPVMTIAQAPVLGTAANFVLFTTNGAMTCSGTKYLTHLTGQVGSNLAGSVTGFGNVDGVMHDFDVASGICVPDVISLYTQLSTAIPTGTLATPFGNGAILAPGVYSIPTAATLNSSLTLDAAGDPNAVFIFQIDGVFTTNASSKVRLVNGALACNVFWQVGGAVNVGTRTFLRGTIVADGQIDMASTLDTLEGRALAMNAPVLVSQLVAYTPIGCGSPYLTGPVAPALASAATYGVFSSIGAVSSTPVTYVAGDVGANTTTPTGFNPLNVTGTIHSMDPSTAAAAGDLTNAYNYLVAMPADILLLDPADFGHGLVLTPHSYQITGITQLTGNIILNAQGNPNAVFVIKINGAFTTGTLSHVVLINGAQAKNVYWKVDGAVNIFSNSVFNGTLVDAGAITLNTGDTLNGKALTTSGAVAINGSYINISPAACVAPPITGTQNVCPGATTLLSNSDTGGIWTSSNPLVATVGSSSGVVTGITPGTAGITYITSSACTSNVAVTVNPSPAPLTGPGNVCVGSSMTLTDITTGGTWSSSNPFQASVGSASGIVSGIANGTPTITYQVPGTCAVTKNIVVGSNAGTITGPSSVCIGSSIILTDTTAGGTWSCSNTTATVVGGVVTGVSAGIDTIMYTVVNGCGTATATKPINIVASPGVGSITGPSSVCVGSSVTLTDPTPGGVWSRSNTRAMVVAGVVTGLSAGGVTISYTVINACGSATATKVMTVNPVPNAGNISGSSSVCVGSTITLTESVTGGAWSSSNATATVSGGIVTGVFAGIDTIRYTVTNICGTATATKPVVVSPLPNAGSISGPSVVCAGSSIVLTDGAPGGIWSGSNATATVVGGVVSGITAGIDTVMYTVSNMCGTAVATKSVTVNPQPDAGTISGLSSVCVSSSIMLVSSISGGSWSSSNSSAMVSGGMVTGFSAGIDTIRYSVTNSCGTATATKSVTVNSLPDAGIITGPSSVCVGASITMSESVSGGTWTSSSAATVSGGVVTGTSPGTATINYTVSDASCTSVTTKNITVDPLPYAGTITGPGAICIGTPITLTDMATGGIWSSSTAAAVVAGGVVTGISAGTSIIRYTVTNNCGTDIAAKTITVSPLPLVPVISTLSPSSVCNGTMYQNFGAATLPPANTIYKWTATNAVIWAQGTTFQYALVNFNTPGIASVTLNASFAGTACVSKSTVVVTTGTGIAQTAEVSYFNSNFVCTPATEDSYQWGYDDANTLDSTILRGEINQDYLNTSPDFYNRYYWVITTLGGCMQKTYYHIPTAVQQVNLAPGITVYPNPANEFINVTVSAPVQGTMQVDVSNMLGQTVRSVNTTDAKATIDIAALPAGTYLIACYSNGVKTATSKFIKY